MAFAIRTTTDGDTRCTTDGDIRITTDVVAEDAVSQHNIKPGRSDVSAPYLSKMPPIHPGEIDFFRTRVYARGVDAMAPPGIVAQSNLTTQHFPRSRPVVDRRPRGK